MNRTVLVCLVLLSLILSVSVIAVAVGISNTPYETKDSAGRTMGFNDRLSPEHYLILLSNIHPKVLFGWQHLYDWFLLAMQGIGAWLLLSSSHWKKAHTRWFFAGQAVLFPLGWLGFLVLPTIFKDVLTGSLDREGVIDLPFVACTAQPVWIAVALLIVCTMPRLPKKASPAASPA